MDTYCGNCIFANLDESDEPCVKCKITSGEQPTEFIRKSCTKRISEMRGEEFERLTIHENVAKLKSNYEGLLKRGLRKERDIPVEKQIKLSAYEDLGYTPHQLKLLIDALSMEKEDAVKYLRKAWRNEEFDAMKNYGFVRLIVWLEEYISLKQMIIGKGEQKITINEYQKLASRTIDKKMGHKAIEYHALHGMVGEIGELHSLYQKMYQGHEFSREHAKKELGDLLWFIAEYCTANGWSMDEIAQINIDKLKARYPDGFETERSLNRAEGDI